MKSFRLILPLLAAAAICFGCAGNASLTLRGRYGPDTTRTIEMRNVGAGINTKRDDYAPFVTSEGEALYFVSAKQEGLVRVMHGEDVEFRPILNHSIFVVLKKSADDTIFGASRELPYPVNSDLDEGNLISSADDSMVVFVACNRPEGIGGCDLYQILDPFSSSVAVTNLTDLNSPYWESSPTLSPDGKTICFVSNRPGTLGGEGDGDMYFSQQIDDWRWTWPVNLGPPINSEFRQDSPSFGAGDSLLFFSSVDPNGYGGFDLYVSHRQADGTWGTPQNLGSPINTEADERYITVTADGRTFYVASNRRDIKNYGGLDIYMVRFIDEP